MEATLRAIARLEGLTLGQSLGRLFEAWVDLNFQKPGVPEEVGKLVGQIGRKRAARQAAQRVAKTFYLGRDLLDRLEASLCAGQGQRAPRPSRGHRFEAVLAAGLDLLPHPREGVNLPSPVRSEGWTRREAKTFYVGREVVERLSQAHRTWNSVVPTSRTDLLEAVVAAGLDAVAPTESLTATG